MPRGPPYHFDRAALSFGTPPKNTTFYPPTTCSENSGSGTAFVCYGAKPNGRFDMATLIIILLIALFCGAMLLLDRMLCGYVKLMSNSKKKRK